MNPSSPRDPISPNLFLAIGTNALHSVEASKSCHVLRGAAYLNARFAIVDDNSVREVGGHDEVVLYDEGCLLRVEDKTLDELGARDTLSTNKKQKWRGKDEHIVEFSGIDLEVERYDYINSHSKRTGEGGTASSH